MSATPKLFKMPAAYAGMSEGQMEDAALLYSRLTGLAPLEWLRDDDDPLHQVTDAALAELRTMASGLRAVVQLVRVLRDAASEDGQVLHSVCDGLDDAALALASSLRDGIECIAKKREG